jgi:predicted ArsR family transcriptional regulator
MSELDLRDRTADAAIGARRSEILSQLRGANEPLTVAEVAQRTGLHVNTARFHLDALVADRLAERSIEHRDTPGRPRVLYSSNADAGQPRSFALLAEMLTGLVASLEGGAPGAVTTGRAWGRHLVDRPAPSERLDADAALQRLNAVLDGIGFAPDIRNDTQGAEVRLHHCPFREVAVRHTDVVCALHLGLMQGALEELRAPVTAVSLEPFVTPTLCVGRLRQASGGSLGDSSNHEEEHS